MQEISPSDAERLLNGGGLALIRRPADGGLVMSADRWRLAEHTDEELIFEAAPTPSGTADPIRVRRREIQRLSWDRLPKQRRRSQVRILLASGEMLTFSGEIGDPPSS